MSKNHDLGLVSSIVRGCGWVLRAWDCNLDLLVPFNAAEMDKAGDWPPRGNAGGLKRFRVCKRPARLRVGERPAAGADAGVLGEGLINVSRRGGGVSRARLVEGTDVTFKLRRLDLDTETSSSKADRLRLLKELKMFGSMFSVSDPASGETARRLRQGAELGVIAIHRTMSGMDLRENYGWLSRKERILPFCRFFKLCKLRIFDSFRTPKG